MRSLSCLIVISALALVGACSSKPSNAPAPVAPDVAKVADAAIAPDAAQEAHGGGGCVYTKMEGRCWLTELGDAPVMRFAGTVDGKTVELPGNPVRDAAAFQPFGLGTNIACTLEFETQGTCTPCMFSVGECGKDAWDAFRAHSK